MLQNEVRLHDIVRSKMAQKSPFSTLWFETVWETIESSDVADQLLHGL